LGKKLSLRGKGFKKRGGIPGSLKDSGEIKKGFVKEGEKKPAGWGLFWGGGFFKL